MGGDGLNGKDVLNVAKYCRSDRDRGAAIVGHGDHGRAVAWKAARSASLARLWLPARLPHPRTDRGRRGSASAAGLLVWRSGLLSRSLERWRLRPMLDPDAGRQCLELRQIAGSRAAGQPAAPAEDATAR